MAITVPHAVFREIDHGVFARDCIGAEAFFCRRSDDGLTQVFYSCKTHFKKDISADELKPMVERTFLRLRHLVPSIACTTSRTNSGGYQFEYRVPQSLEDATKWAQQVVFIHEDGVSFQDSHERIVRERHWKASDGRYTHELHATPSLLEGKSSWTFTLSAQHCNIDGRTAWMMFDNILEYLSEEINRGPVPLSSYGWGAEVGRLSPAGPMVWSLNDTGEPEPLPLIDASQLPPPPKDIIPWDFPARVIAEQTTQADRVIWVKLSPEETTRFRAACKAHGQTVTHVTTAILLLTDVESALRTAAATGPERFQEVLAGFEGATHLVTKLIPVSMRPYMPKAYQVFGEERTGPLLAIDSVPLVSPFSPFRKMFSVDKTARNVTRKTDMSVFWDELTVNAANGWNAQDKSIEAYRLRSAVTHSSDNVHYIPSSRDDVTLGISSLGDLSRLGHLEAFRPSSGNKTLVVEDIVSSMRYTRAGGMGVFFQYEDQFRVKVTKGARYATKEELELQSKILREWFDAILSS